MNQNQKSTGGKAPRKFLATKAARRQGAASSEIAPKEKISKKAMEMAEEYMANLESEIPEEIKDAMKGSKNAKLLYCFIIQMKIAHHS